MIGELATELERAAGRLVDTCRRLPVARWHARVDAGGSAADLVQQLVTWLAEVEHAVEIGQAQRPKAWRSPAPAPYPGALPDRLAVVSNDLIAALKLAPGDKQAWRDGELVTVAALADAALVEIQAVHSAVSSAVS